MSGCRPVHVVSKHEDETQSCHMECKACPDVWFCEHNEDVCSCPLIEDEKNEVKYENNS